MLISKTWCTNRWNPTMKPISQWTCLRRFVNCRWIIKFFFFLAGMSVSCCCCCRCRRRCLTVVLIACPPLLYRFLHCGKSLWRMDESRWMAMEEVYTHTVHIDVCGVYVPAWNIWEQNGWGSCRAERNQMSGRPWRLSAAAAAWKEEKKWNHRLDLKNESPPPFVLASSIWNWSYFLLGKKKQQQLAPVAAVVASLLSPNREAAGIIVKVMAHLIIIIGRRRHRRLSLSHAPHHGDLPRLSLKRRPLMRLIFSQSRSHDIVNL